MENGVEFFKMLLDSEELLNYGGLTLLLILIFLETGFFFGFFFPGDTLLFSAGLFCGTKHLDVHILLLLVTVTAAAIGGNIIGYFSGKYFGKKLFSRKDSFFFKKKHLETTKAYYMKYGGVSIIAGRFLPIVRTFVPILAGTIDMKVWRFMFFNVSGAFLWVWTLIPIGYFLGQKFPNIIHNLEYFVIGITLITVVFLYKGYKSMKNEKAAVESEAVES
jgi:membrane-associated protein